VSVAKKVVKDALKGAEALLGHNLKFDLNMARADDWDIDPWVPIHDTMIQAYLIRENRSLALENVVTDIGCSPYGEAREKKAEVEAWIEAQARRCRLGKHDYLNAHGHEEVPVGLEGEYACRDAGHTLALHRAQYEEARGYTDSQHCLYANEMLLVRALADMEYVGQPIDVGYLKRVALQLDQELSERGDELVKSFGVRLEWNNDGQLRQFLFDTLKLPVTATTKRGQPSVDRASLMALADRHAGMEPLMEWRARFKIRSTYTDSLIEKADDNSRLHASFVQFGTATGRLSSRNPNLQNVPSRHEELSKLVRRAFLIDEGKARIYCDYSQIELRMLAWITQSPTLLAAYESEAYGYLLSDAIDRDRYLELRAHESSTDVHALVARQVFGIEPGDRGFKKKRSAAKIINFGVPYGGGPNLLMGNPELRLGEAESRRYFNQYHAQNPEIETTRKRLLDSMRADPELSFTNWAGRRRHGPRLAWQRKEGIECPVAEEERSMFASLVQGSAGELTRFSLVRLWLLQQRGVLPAVTTSTVHDEIQVDCAQSDTKEVATIVKATMEDFTGLFGTVPVIANLETTDSNWSEKAEYEL
jgi:DNA polymerase-1